MDLKYEITNQSGNIPIRLWLHQVNYVNRHWHDSIEILFVLKGNVEVFVQQQAYELVESDLIVINTKELHSLSGKGENLVLALQIPMEYIVKQFPGFNKLTLNCKSFLYADNQREVFDRIRHSLAKIMNSYIKEAYGYEVEIGSLVLEFLHYLISNFREDVIADEYSDKHKNRLLSILNKIKDNYNKPITLQEIAESEYLSVSYLSKFFNEHIGMSFPRYVNTVRLEKVVETLITTDIPIIDIALRHGFPNEKSLYKLFKEVYGITPRQYRLQNPKASNELYKQNNLVNYLDINRKSALANLFSYIKGPESFSESKSYARKLFQKVELKKIEKPITHNWRNTTSIGKAKEGLYAPVQEQLTILQKEIGFKQIRFHGIFDDEMMIYAEDEAGAVKLSFVYVDQLFDFLLSIGLRPFVELGYMPSALASSDQSVFNKKSYVSKPKDLDKWGQLVEGFVDHVINRYGIDEVKQWNFEVWNEPEIGCFWADTFEDFCQLYKKSYDTIKGISKEIKVGGTGIFSASLLISNWLQEFLEYGKQNDCYPDFVSFHSYPYDLESTEALQIDSNMDSLASIFLNPLIDTAASIPLSLDENYLSKVIHVAKEIVQEKGDATLHMTEWNSTGSHRDLINDTCFKAAYIIKNLSENLDEIDSYCYWTMTDLLEEFQASPDIFHGGLGLFTSNGIKKAAYYAYWFLSRLGNTLIDRGSYYIITKENDSYQMIVYNYSHYDKLYSFHDDSNIDLVNRYDVFAENETKEFTIALEGLREGVYTISKSIVNRKHGSSFDNWVEMGHPKSLTKEDIKYLQNISVPKREKYMEETAGNLAITTVLSPNEIQLFEITPKR